MRVGEAQGGLEVGPLRDGHQDLAGGVRDPQGDPLGGRTPPQGDREGPSGMVHIDLDGVRRNAAEQGESHGPNLP